MIGPKFHVAVLFILQLVFFLLVFGGVVPHFHRQGVSLILLVLGSVGGVLLFHYLLGLLGRLVPARCRACRSGCRFQGFGWWPFTYRYRCSGCGNEARLEVTG